MQKVISVLALFSAITLPGCCAVTPTSLSKTPAPTNVAVMETVSAENDYYTYLSQDIDLDDDRIADTITAYRTEEMQDAFWLEVTFGNEHSLNNLKELGYEIKTWYQKDENIKRYILLKRLEDK